MNRAYFALPLIALVAVPTLVATLDGLSDRQFRETTVARESARVAVRALAERLDERISTLRNTLTLVSEGEAARAALRGEPCAAPLERSLRGLHSVDALMIIDRTGRVQCASDPALAGRLVRGDNALRTVLRGKADWIVTSGVPAPPGDGTDFFAIAVPLRDESGNAIAALAAGTSSADLTAPAGDERATAWLIQEGGETVGRTLGNAPERAANQTLAELRSFFVGRIAAEVETLGGDGVRRVFGILPGASHEHGITVAVGVPVTPIGPAAGSFAGAAALITLIVSTLLAASLAWTFRERVGRPGSRDPAVPAGAQPPQTGAPVSAAPPAGPAHAAEPAAGASLPATPTGASASVGPAAFEASAKPAELETSRS